jgi:hypothetical protein
MQSNTPYASWPFVEGIEIDGWRFGSAMSYSDQSWGDAFVEAPDGSRAGIVGVIRDGPIKQLIPPDQGRWGVYEIPFKRAMRNSEDLMSNFKSVLGSLQVVHKRVTAKAS